MANFDEFYKEAKNWAKKNTLFFEIEEDGLEKDNEAFLEGYYNLPERFFEKNDNFEKVYEPLEKLYIIEKYIDNGTIVL
jgi:hypothetical protein|tara:strand:+ start:6210 stop:6446 length:237 start_codon:yes stop_codon:yes gene_type:complete